MISSYHRSSIRHAIVGVKTVWFRERNFRREVVGGMCIFIFSFFLPVTFRDRFLLLFLVLILLAAELANSGIEYLLDMVKPRLHEQVKVVKDAAAGAVFILAVGCAVVGIQILFPAFIELFRTS